MFSSGSTSVILWQLVILKSSTTICRQDSVFRDTIPYTTMKLQHFWNSKTLKTPESCKSGCKLLRDYSVKGITKLERIWRKLSSTEMSSKLKVVLCWTEKTWRYFLRKENIDYYDIWSSKIFLEENINWFCEFWGIQSETRFFKAILVKLKRDWVSVIETKWIFWRFFISNRSWGE